MYKLDYHVVVDKMWTMCPHLKINDLAYAHYTDGDNHVAVCKDCYKSTYSVSQPSIVCPNCNRNITPSEIRTFAPYYYNGNIKDVLVLCSNCAIEPEHVARVQDDVYAMYEHYDQM